jgi:hypothetical protein
VAKKTSTNYQLTDTVGQNAPGKFTSTGYTVKAGFQYIYDSMQKFSFAISDLDLNFGTLTPNIGSTQTNTVTITTPSGKGYEILAIANHPLQTISSSTIPNTNCDSGCSISTSGAWTQSTNYGFGFNATGDGTSTYFTDNTYYRPFAATSKTINRSLLCLKILPSKITPPLSPTKLTSLNTNPKAFTKTLLISSPYQNIKTSLSRCCGTSPLKKGRSQNYKFK